MLSTAEAILARRSVRGFLPREVPEATLRTVFELAQHAPSNANSQPWRVHVLSGAACDAMRKRLVDAAHDGVPESADYPYSGKYEGVYRERQFDAAYRLYDASGIARDDRDARRASFMRNYAFFDAPHVAFVFLPQPFDLRGAADCGMYIQTLMLAMTAHGIASCPQTALSMRAAIVRDQLGLPDTERLFLGISFGYEDPAVAANATRVGRAPLEQAVTFHR